MKKTIQVLALAVALCIIVVTSTIVKNETTGKRPHLVNQYLEGDYVIVTENIEGGNSSNVSGVLPSKSINLTGFWDMTTDSTINVSIEVADNLGQNKEQILNYSRQAIFPSNIDHQGLAMNETNSQAEGSWPQLLTALSQDNSNPLPHLQLSDTNGTETSKIRVLLTADNHPARRNGQATVTLTSEGRIVFVEITIFHTDILYNEKYLAHVLEHEMGHALGLSHANYMESVMYPKIVDVNGSVLGEITACEEKGLISLYVQSSKDLVLCD